MKHVQKSSSNLLLYFVNDIIDFSRIRSNKFKQSISTFSLEPAILEVTSILQTQTLAQGIKICCFG